MFRRCSSLAILAPALPLLLVASLSSQTAQPPANYHGPNLFGVCVYIVGDTSFYSNVFNTSGYFKFKAQQAFQQYAMANARGAQLRGSGCRWSTSQDEINTQKAQDKRLLGQAGRSAKGVETGWSYTPAATDAPAYASDNSTTRQASSPATAPGSSTPASTTSGSVTASTQQTVQNSLAASKASATGAVNDTVATTMGTVTSGATNAVKGLFNRKQKPSSTAQPNPPDSGATGATPAPLGFESTESPQAATAEAQTIQGLVADVSGNDIIINVGTQAGVRPGTHLAVMHPLRTVKDPATGKVLRTVEDKVGELTVKNADATSAAGTFAGTTTAKVGDTVRSEPQ